MTKNYLVVLAICVFKNKNKTCVIVRCVCSMQFHYYYPQFFGRTYCTNPKPACTLLCPFDLHFQPCFCDVHTPQLEVCFPVKRTAFSPLPQVPRSGEAKVCLLSKCGVKTREPKKRNSPRFTTSSRRLMAPECTSR